MFTQFKSRYWFLMAVWQFATQNIYTYIDLTAKERTKLNTRTTALSKCFDICLWYILTAKLSDLSCRGHGVIPMIMVVTDSGRYRCLDLLFNYISVNSPHDVMRVNILIVSF